MSSGDRLRMTTAPLLIVSIGFVVGGTTALALYYAGVYQELLRGLAGGAVAGGFIGYLASIRWRDRIGLSLGTQRAFWVGHTILAAIVILLTFLTAVKTGSRFFYLMSVWMVLSELSTHSIRRDYPCATVTLALLATVVGLCMSLMHPIFLVLVFFSGGAAVKEIRRLRAGGGVV